MKFLYSFCFAMLLIGAFAQTPDYMKNRKPENPKDAHITGKIIDVKTGQAMKYANIMIYRSQDSLLLTTDITNSEGLFNFKKLKSGNYFIEVDFVGFKKLRINNIQINPDKKNIDLGMIELQPDNQEIGTVDVTADRVRAEYKIDKKVIHVAQDIKAVGGTAVDVLENAPSVKVDITGEVTLRGSSNFIVLIDGRPSVLAGRDALERIPASAIENIEIVTNPSVKYDPDGKEGVINLVMKKDVLSGFNGIINTAIGKGENRQLDVTLNQKTKKRNILLAFDSKKRDFWNKMQSGREGHYNDTTRFLSRSGRGDYLRTGNGIKAGLDLFLSESTTLGFAGDVGNYESEYSDKEFIHNYSSPASLNNKYTIGDDISFREGNYYNGNINFLHHFNGNNSHKLEGFLFYSKSKETAIDVDSEFLATPDFESTGIYDLRFRTIEDENSDQYRITLDYAQPLGKNGKIEAGFQSRIDRRAEAYTFEDYQLETQDWTNNPDFSSLMDFKRDIHSFYSTYSHHAEALDFMIGIRGEHINRVIEHTKVDEAYKINRFDFFPSVHLSKDLMNGNQLIASYSRRIKRPSVRDLDPFANYENQYVVRIGNPGLEPEYVNSYELAFIKRFGTSFISLESFYRVTNNLITREGTSIEDGIFYLRIKNLNKNSLLGGEFVANLNITKWFLLNSSFSIFNYRLEGEINGESVDRESMSYQGRFNGIFRLGTGSRFQFTGIYDGPLIFPEGRSKEMFYSDISYRQDFLKKKLTATISMKDVFASGKEEGTSDSSAFKSYFKFQREPRVVTFTLSYKINNFKLKRSNKREDDMIEMDFSEVHF